jgi:hypothetical protein
MTTAERVLNVLAFKKPDHIPNVDFGYWDETIQKWYVEGLPRSVTTNAEVESYLGLEGVSVFPAIPLVNGLFPAFSRTVLEDRGEHLIIQDHEGNICEVPAHGSSIPRYIKFVIESKADWARFRDERLDYRHPERIANLDLFAGPARKTGLPIFFNAGSLYGWLRNWMGVENLSYAVMSEKEWVAEMMDHLVEMSLYLIDKMPGGLVDLAWWWEDMCYNRGPLLSPKLFNELMVPRYKEITRALAGKGVRYNLLDCDGCIYELVNGWLEGGINVMFPIEAAHTDPGELRNRFGRTLLMIGGVDKRALIKGGDAIDRELEKLAPLVAEGGYIPTLDHRVPPDVSFSHYLYYLEKRKSMWG